MNRKIIFFVMIFALLIGCNKQNTSFSKGTLQKDDAKMSTIADLIKNKNYKNFTEELLDGDLFIYRYDDKNYIVSKEWAEEINLKNCFLSDDNKSIVGLKGNTTTLCKYSIEQKSYIDLFNLEFDAKFEILAFNGIDKIVVKISKPIDEVYECNLNDTSKVKLFAELYKDHELYGFSCLDYSNGNYLARITYSNDKNKYNNKIALLSKEGKTIREFKHDSELPISNELTVIGVSPDNNYYYFSLGQTPVDINIYDMKMDSIKMLTKYDGRQAFWSKVSNSLYWVESKIENKEIASFLHRYDLN